MKFTESGTSWLRAGLLLCALGTLSSLDSRVAWATAYARVDVDINNVLVSGVSGTTVVGLGSSGQEFKITNSAVSNSLFLNLSDTQQVDGIGAAPRAFVGNPAASNQTENDIFTNTNPLTPANFARSDSLVHVSPGTNTLVSGGVNMDAVGEASISVPAAYTQTNNGASQLFWDVDVDTGLAGGTRNLNVSFGWTRRSKAVLDIGYDPPSLASVDFNAFILIYEIRNIGGTDTDIFRTFAAPGTFGTLVDNPDPLTPGDLPIDSNISGGYSTTFSIAPLIGPGTFTGRFRFQGGFGLEAEVTLAIPEPSGIALTALGAFGMLAVKRRRSAR